MVLMVLDHTRDFFTNHPVNFDDPSHLSYAYFFTRWLTHLCAPTFVFLSGVAAYLQIKRGKTKGELSVFLAKRGLWLMLLEITVVSFGFFFCASPPFVQVIWVLGLSMILLSGMIWLPMPVILSISLLLIAGHNHFDTVRAASFGGKATLWMLLHQGGPLTFHGHIAGFLLYPLVPWNAVMALGYCFGPVVCLHKEHRVQITAWLGTVSVALFFVLRMMRGYGDPNGWTASLGTRQLITTFLNVEKYPPSLQYVLLMLGLALLLLALFDSLLEGGHALWLRNTFEVYGRVPLVYYLSHIYLLHTLALATCLAMGCDPHLLLSPFGRGSLLAGSPPGYGYGLPGIYVMWLIVVALLYLPMRSYATFKRTHPTLWWLSYL